jgi:hypothetical protein
VLRVLAARNRWVTGRCGMERTSALEALMMLLLQPPQLQAT